jgi:dGTPase
MTTPPLAALACDPAHSRGRLFPESDGGNRGPRTAFQRDRDRIIHSVAFRRLRHKTQVFIAPDGDHFRVRLTHSLEVAQIGRTIARALGLNEDLTEALCLAHDIGHPPFGHAGEDVMHAIMAPAGGFDHNAHCLRILARIESPYPHFDGLNLSWEMQEGLAKHNGPVRRPNWALAEIDAAFPLDLYQWPSLEAQVAALADDIAYDNHDMDDGLRAGLISLEDLDEVPFVAANLARIRRHLPGLARDRLIAELVRDQIGLMVNDLIAATAERVRSAQVRTVDDVRAAGRMLAGFSDEIASAERALKAFLYRRLYRHDEVKAVSRRAAAALDELFRAYLAHPERLPEEWQATLPSDEPARTRHIGDFMAGMTDRYALARYREWIGPIRLPAGV